MNRIVFTLPVILLACSTSEFNAEETESALTIGPSVRIMSPLDGESVSLYAVRTDADGSTSYVGTRIRNAVVKEGVATITLPARAARRDKDPEDSAAPVSYVAMSHGTAEGGAADGFSGVSREMISYYTGRDGSGRSGWYVVNVEDGEAHFARTDKTVTIDAQIAPVESVTLSGSRGRLVIDAKLGFITDEGPVEGADFGFGEEGSFEYIMSGEPATVQEGEDGSLYQVMNMVAFGDEDHDGAWGPEEAMVGEVCFGLSSIFLEWREPAQSAAQALAMARSGAKSGWRTYARSEEGPLGMGDAELSAQESCSAAVGLELSDEEPND
jgi:hypothetical protein